MIASKKKPPKARYSIPRDYLQVGDEVDVFDEREIYRRSAILPGKEQFQGNICRVIVQDQGQYEANVDTQHRTQKGGEVSLLVELLMGSRIVHDEPAIIEMADDCFRSVSTQYLVTIHRALTQHLEKNDALVNVLSAATDLHSSGEVDKALDYIYDTLDDLLLSNSFSDVNRLLEIAEADKLPLDIALAILTVTLPAKSKLESRKEFFDKLAIYLTTTGRLSNGLLEGLS